MAQDEFSGWQNAKDSFAFVVAHLGLAARIAGPWLAVTTLVAYGANHWVTLLASDLSAWTSEQIALMRVASGFLALVVFGLGYAVIAVAWHRIVLRREAVPALLPGGAALLYLLLITAMYAVAWFVPFGGAYSVATGLAGERLTKSASMIFLLALAAAVALVGFFLRFTLKLPAIALGDGEMTLRRSWSETAALWPGMLWGTVVISVPLFAATRATNIIARLGLNEVVLFLDYAAYYALIFASALIYATFLSFAYRGATGDVATAFE